MNKSFDILKITFYENAQEQFLSTKFDNLLSTFFLRPPRSTISPPVEPNRTITLLHRPSNHLNKSFDILKIIFYENAQEQFLSTKFDNLLSTFFLRPPRSTISPPVEPTRTMTLLPRPSNHLNKSFDILKIIFYENAQEQFLSTKFDNLLSTFFLRPPRSTISPPVEPNRTITLLHRPSNHLNKSFDILKITFYENAQEQFLSTKFDNLLSTFFLRPPRSTISPPVEPNRTIALLHRPSNHLNKSFDILKMIFYENAQEQFLSTKFDNLLSTFSQTTLISN